MGGRFSLKTPSWEPFADSVCGGWLAADPKYSNVPKVSYELPDGTVVGAGIERFRVPEILMDPTPVLPLLGSLDDPEWSKDSLPAMVVESVFRCDKELVRAGGMLVVRGGGGGAWFDNVRLLVYRQQAALVNNIVLGGGGACIDGALERLKLEVEAAMNGQQQVSERGLTPPLLPVRFLLGLVPTFNLASQAILHSLVVD
jgi:actin-related protein